MRRAFLDNHFGDVHVVVRRFIEGGGNHLAFDHTAKIRHFFRSLIDQQNDQIGIRVVSGQGVGQVPAG